MKNLELDRLGVLSVDDYVDITSYVWKGIHYRRSVLDYVLHVLDHASKLGEAIRRDDADLILEETADTANWLFGFVRKLNDRKTGWESRLNIPTKLSRIIWSKYPGLCPHCFQRVYIANKGKKTADEIVGQIEGKCRHCLIDYPKVEKRSELPSHGKPTTPKLKQASLKELRDYAHKTERMIPKSLRDMEKMFHNIYESNTALATPESIGFHLLEETGEMGRAVIDIYTEKNNDPSMDEKLHSLCDEVAEVFAWLCSLTLRVRSQAETFDRYKAKLVSYTLPSDNKSLADNVGLEEILWVTYRDKGTVRYNCPYCKKPVCSCPLKFAWDEEPAKQVRAQKAH